MAKIRNKRASPQSGKPRPAPIALANPTPVSLVAMNPGEAEMSGNGPEILIPTLTFRQQAALPAIALAPNITRAARDSGIGQSTLRRWLQGPHFRQQLAHFRQESADLARQQAQSLLPRCLSVFAEAMEGPDLSLRLRAARYAMSFALQLAEVQTLKSSLQELEEAIQATSDASPPRLR